MDFAARSGLDFGSKPGGGSAASGALLAGLDDEGGRDRGGVVDAELVEGLDAEVGPVERGEQLADRAVVVAVAPRRTSAAEPTAANGWSIASTNGAPGLSTRCTWRSVRPRSSSSSRLWLASTRSIVPLGANPRSASSPWWHSTDTPADAAAARRSAMRSGSGSRAMALAPRSPGPPSCRRCRARPRAARRVTSPSTCSSSSPATPSPYVTRWLTPRPVRSHSPRQCGASRPPAGGSTNERAGAAG